MSTQQYFEQQAANKAGLQRAIQIVQEQSDQLPDRLLLQTEDEKRVVRITFEIVMMLLDKELQWSTRMQLLLDERIKTNQLT